MTALTLRDNPYVGLRPFFERDSLYFFGRGAQLAELLEILHTHRFLGVVGSSGSGKSSLVRAGLLPKLLGGFLAQERDRWRIVRMKPGDAPIGNLASALLDAMGEGSSIERRRELEQQIRDEHTDALVDYLRARLEPNANVFVLVDQFEEIFAFRGAQDENTAAATDAVRWKERAHRRAEAADFVDLLLELSQRRDLPIYVALTMRTDFLGECDLFYGLPEALNRGRYLVPRLTRQQLREAIEGPALLLGARIEPRLLDSLLNALGDRFDRLPVLQHALLRTWDAWAEAGRVGPIDFPHYERAGGLERALDRDAEGALSGLDAQVASALFKRLTDTDLRERRIRSPARVSELMATCGADRAAIDAIIQRFEGQGRSFVYTADDGTPDDPRVDIAHESLIRQWDRLRQWVDAERRSRDQYRELAARARKHERGAAALLQDPELRAMVDWRDESRPSAAWAARYSAADDDFACAARYLDSSVDAQCHRLADDELARGWKNWNALILLAVMLVALSSEIWRSPDAGREEGAGIEAAGSRQPAAAVATTRLGDLEWTTDDRRVAMNWLAASDYCDDLVVGSRSDWRLPSTGELLDIYDAGTATPQGLKLAEPFHQGVTSRWIWSVEAGEEPSTNMAADFAGAVFVPLPPEDQAHTLCVSWLSSTEKPDVRDQRNNLVRWLEQNLPLGSFVLAYLVLAWVGRRIHRRLAYPRILRGFAASGGRDPRAAAAKAERLDAVDVHGTSYASTLRRVAGYGIDLVIHLVVAFAILAVIAVVQDARVTVTLPSGERIEGVLVDSDDKNVSLITAEGRERSFPLTTGPRVDVIDGVPVAAALPSGAPVEGRSFEQVTVAVTLPNEERIEGRLEEMDAEHVTLTTADGARRSFPIDPNMPEVDIVWPPDDAGLVWFLVLCLVFGWLYEALQLSSASGATLGMRALGIFRTDLHGRQLSFARASGWYGYRLLSYLAYLLGFVSQPFTRRRQTFHDWMAGSVVLRRPRAGAASN